MSVAMSETRSGRRYGPNMGVCALWRPDFRHFEGIPPPSRWTSRAVGLLQRAHGRGRARAHSSAPEGSAQSASRSLRGRYRQCLVDSRIELPGELRLPLVQSLQGCRSANTTKNSLDTSVYGVSCHPSPLGAVVR